MNQEKNGVWTSWNDNITSNYESLYKITSEKELQEVVKNSKKIRVFGNKQSSADIASGVATLVDIRPYNQVVSFDGSKQTITVQSGIIFCDFL